MVRRHSWGAGAKVHGRQGVCWQCMPGWRRARRALQERSGVMALMPVSPGVPLRTGGVHRQQDHLRRAGGQRGGCAQPAARQVWQPDAAGDGGVPRGVRALAPWRPAQVPAPWASMVFVPRQPAGVHSGRRPVLTARALGASHMCSSGRRGACRARPFAFLPPPRAQPLGKCCLLLRVQRSLSCFLLFFLFLLSSTARQLNICTTFKALAVLPDTFENMGVDRTPLRVRA